LINEQTNYFNSMFEDYNKKYNNIKSEIEESLKVLVSHSAEFDEAVDTAIRQYEKMKEDMDKKIAETMDKNRSEMKNLKETYDGEKNVENNFKSLLDLKISESDKIIQKNADIKKNIIETTQRIITFQEQLLETEKNLHKIDNKIKDLDSKNKHLEQIRFVLEHRMTSLDKEKAPLEGQCIFLEKQKNNLQEEFNKLILQINLRNQFLENKQSQLKACLIQNFEVSDQIHYIKKKLTYLQNEIKSFIVTYQDDGSGPNKLKPASIQQNKATYVALQLRQFYDKYFSNNIDEELKNYQYYLAKLQEETEKMNIANNFDLIMRDKGEEKLIAEREKLEQIKELKEKGFRRMQNENTVLISECNRLRKNLHEIYMHVVDIEQKFEDLTKINPNLNKTEIVYQIKEFIRQTHNKIKSNFRDGMEELEEDFEDEIGINNSNIHKNIEILDGEKELNNLGVDIIKSVDEHNENLLKQNKNLDNIKVIINIIY
jgi:hypothetical protein